jgi:hypothetical protein
MAVKQWSCIVLLDGDRDFCTLGEVQNLLCSQHSRLLEIKSAQSVLAHLSQRHSISLVSVNTQLRGKCEVLNSSPSTNKNRKKEKENTQPSQPGY